MDRKQPITRVEELDVFKLAHELTKDIYRVTKVFPKEEIYGLTSQLRRASLSIASNLAEGGNRNSRAEFKYPASVSKGSAAELRYQLLLAKEIGYMDEEDYKKLAGGCERVLKMLQKLTKSLA